MRSRGLPLPGRGNAADNGTDWKVQNFYDVIIQAGFKFIELDRQSMRGVPAIVRPSIRGVAVKGELYHVL